MVRAGPAGSRQSPRRLHPEEEQYDPFRLERMPVFHECNGDLLQPAGDSSGGQRKTSCSAMAVRVKSLDLRLSTELTGSAKQLNAKAR